MNENLTAHQKDYSIFLPSLSTFYATFVGRDFYEDYIDKTRLPSNFVNGVQSINYLDPNKGLFQYKWSLYSAGHAELDTTKECPKEDMIRKRNRSNTWIMGDSGGFQIGKGLWEGDWTSSTCPKSHKKRDQVLKWMDAYMDYGMILDIPAWLSRSPKGQEVTGITTYQQAVDGTKINNDYWIKNRNGSCKFLNVLQGETHSQAEDWYQQLKHYCDPKIYPDAHFNGWAFGGQNMCSTSLALKRIVSLIHDNLLEPGIHDVIHFLGTSKLEWAVLMTDIQRAVRKYHNPNLLVTFDCASPFLATANGQIYVQTEVEDRKKWSYRMTVGADDKKYANDSRLFRDAVLQDKILKHFEDSPITKNLKISDVCTYAPGDLNKIGKEGKTSWDSFSYAIQMAHNIWMHINAVQEANRKYDSGACPKMLVEETFDRIYFRDVVYDVFSQSDKNKALKIIDDYDRYLTSIIGTRGSTGKKEINAKTYFEKLFE